MKNYYAMTDSELSVLITKMRRWLEYYDRHEKAPEVRRLLSLAVDALDTPEPIRLDPFVSVVFDALIRYNSDS